MDTPTLKPTWWGKMCEVTSYTPLAVACYEHNPTMVKALLENGSTFEGAKEGANGRSPVFFALSAPYSSELLDVLILLADAGEDFGKDPYDGYPLHWASRCQLPQMSAEPLTKQEYHHGIAEIIIFIMQHMPNPYVAHGNGFTALHYAAIRENWYLCELLVSVYKFPLASRTNVDGLTAYDIALQNNAPAEILCLLKP
jgi:ankyrin repeat protein